MKLLTALYIFCILLCSSKAMCCFALRAKEFNPEASQRKSYYTGKEIRFDQTQVKGREELSSKDVAKIIPLHLRATNDSQRITSEILKNTTRSITRSQMLKNSVIGKTMDDLKASPKTLLGHIKKALFDEQDLLSSTDEKKSDSKTATKKAVAFDAREALATEHKFKLKLRANNQEARVVYKGYLDSQVKYSGRDEAFHVSIQERLSENSKIALSHRTDPRGSQQTVNFRVNW